jgi:predicted NAD/FAD-binding protein
MPKNIKCWASWVYKKTEEDKPILSYWMNSLQDIDKKYPIFVSLNPENYIDNNKIFNKHILEHPIFDMSARKAQKQIPSIQ